MASEGSVSFYIFKHSLNRGQRGRGEEDPRA